MGSLKACRHTAALAVQWPLLYANKTLIGQGTILNLSHSGCYVAGTMPVAAGMMLKMWISPAHRHEAFYVKEARVLWARGHEFGLEWRQADIHDHQWLLSFLENGDLDITF